MAKKIGEDMTPAERREHDEAFLHAKRIFDLMTLLLGPLSETITDSRRREVRNILQNGLGHKESAKLHRIISDENLHRQAIKMTWRMRAGRPGDERFPGSPSTG